MAQVLAIKPGRLKAADRKALKVADIIVLEIDDPDELRIVRVDGLGLAASELSWAAIAAIDACGSALAQSQLTKNLKKLIERRLRKEPPVEPDHEEEHPE
jgi:hypothetical protein